MASADNNSTDSQTDDSAPVSAAVAVAGSTPTESVVAVEAAMVNESVVNQAHAQNEPGSPTAEINGESSSRSEAIVIAAVTKVPTSTPLPSATPSPLPTQTPSPTPTLTAAPTATPIPPPTPIPTQVVTITVPRAYQINARPATTTDSPSLGLLEKGATFPAIARTLDSAWTQIVLRDGRVAWVFTTSMVADLERIETLPVSVELLNIDPAAYAQYTDTQSNEPPKAAAALPEADTAGIDPDVDTNATTESRTQEVSVQTHQVEAGDFLKQLAERYYGDEELWTLIYEANSELIGADPNLLPAGVELTIPSQ